MKDFYVGLHPTDALKAVSDYIVDGSITGTILDEHIVISQDGTATAVGVYEKHFYRAGNRLCLTVIIDDSKGKTRVHSVGGGGGSGLMRFDWGASDSFENAAERALGDYIIN